MTKKKRAEKRRPQSLTGASARFEKLISDTSETERYSFCLYVTGTTRRSADAITNIRSLCEEFLPGRYDLEVIDVYQRPIATMDDQIFAVPTLIKKLPLPVKRVIGDLSDRDKLILGLDIRRNDGTSKYGTIQL